MKACVGVVVFLVILSVACAVTFDDSIDFDDEDGFTVVNNGDAVKYPDFLENSSVRFDECRVVHRDVEGSDKKKTERFVVFRLCPADSCKTCEYNYGEYVMELEEYLFAVSYYLQIEQQERCAMCENECSEKGSGLKGSAMKCDTCVENCRIAENMQENHYVDAFEYAGCELIFEGVGGEMLYAGASCSANGKIKIQVFTDEDCQTVDPSKQPENFMNDRAGPVKIAYGNFKLAQNQHHCMACHTPDGLSMTGLCEQLYDSADKCEKKLELGNNQQKAEEEACEFIEHLHAGKFDD